MSKHTEELVEEQLDGLLEGGEARTHALASLRAFGAGALQAAICRILELQERNFWCDARDGEAVDAGWTEHRIMALAIQAGKISVDEMAGNLERRSKDLLDLAKELRR